MTGGCGEARLSGERRPGMRKSMFTPEQILQALRQAAGGTAVVDICRKVGVTVLCTPIRETL